MKHNNWMMGCWQRGTWIVLLACSAMAIGFPEDQGSGPGTVLEVETTATPLELAFQAASALPQMPHAKTRARLQEQVALAYLGAGDADRAEACFDLIDNWRRGVGYADLAQHWVLAGQPKRAEALLQRALAVGEDSRGTEQQAWRRGRILGKASAVLMSLGRDGEAAKLAAGLESVEAMPVQLAQMRKLGRGDWDLLAERLKHAVAAGQFEEQRAALEAACEFQSRFYEDSILREKVLSAIHTSWGKMPAQVRLGLIQTLGATAQANGDGKAALTQLEMAEDFMAGLVWRVEEELPWVAAFAKLRANCGDRDGAKEALRRALLRYDAGEKDIVDIYRSGALRPLAEAYVVLGERERAQAIYRRALDAGGVNPNSRPRAEDFVATVCSMTGVGFQPNAALLQHMAEFQGTLGAPW
jgi:tetratricopeptide (TPR) repeat protein